MEFLPFPKIPRLKREICVTEKIDGTNAQVHIRPIDSTTALEFGIDTQITLPDGRPALLRAGSRNRWLPNSPDGNDNYGFGAWTYFNAHELAKLGEGQHFGEWWGLGIGRGYRMTEKRFSLFNVHRWADGRQPRPACCHVVPTLGWGDWTLADECLARLREHGSVAAPGCMNPEGIIIYHGASKSYFKATLDKDDLPKGAA